MWGLTWCDLNLTGNGVLKSLCIETQLQEFVEIENMQCNHGVCMQQGCTCQWIYQERQHTKLKVGSNTSTIMEPYQKGEKHVKYSSTQHKSPRTKFLM